jgi:Tol biopolymer transport system component
MYCPICRLPIARRLRARLARIVALVLALGAGACDGGDTQLGPESDPTHPDGQAAETVSTEASLITASERIAFVSYRDPGQLNFQNGNIYKIHPQGTSEVRITGSLDDDRAPSWSWDNKRIALVRARPVSPNDFVSDIYIVDADGTNGHWASPTPSSHQLIDPSWSPDGKFLVLSVYLEPRYRLALMDLATGNVYVISPLTGGFVGYRPVLDKTGTKLLFVGDSGRTIEQVNLDGTGHKIRVSALVALDTPRWSPDGKKIAYTKVPSMKNSDVWVKDLVTGVNKRLTFNTTWDQDPSWSPDGTRLAFMSNRSGKSQIYTMNAATGGGLVQVTKTSSHEMHPVWTH